MCLLWEDAIVLVHKTTAPPLRHYDKDNSYITASFPAFRGFFPFFWANAPKRPGSCIPLSPLNLFHVYDGGAFAHSQDRQLKPLNPASASRPPLTALWFVTRKRHLYLIIGPYALILEIIIAIREIMWTLSTPKRMLISLLHTHSFFTFV